MAPDFFLSTITKSNFIWEWALTFIWLTARNPMALSYRLLAGTCMLKGSVVTFIIAQRFHQQRSSRNFWRHCSAKCVRAQSDLSNVGLCGFLVEWEPPLHLLTPTPPRDSSPPIYAFGNVQQQTSNGEGKGNRKAISLVPIQSRRCHRVHMARRAP